MKKQYFLSLITSLVLLTLLTACDSIMPASTTEAESTEIPIVIADTEIISEGRLVPNQYVNLSFKSGGQVVELLVDEGEVVDEGQVMARLGNREQLEAAVAAVQVELLNAEQARDKLFENSDVSTALAYQAVTDARDALRDGERYKNNLEAGSRQTSIDTARADVIVLTEKLNDAIIKDTRIRPMIISNARRCYPNLLMPSKNTTMRFVYSTTCRVHRAS